MIITFISLAFKAWWQNSKWMPSQLMGRGKAYLQVLFALGEADGVNLAAKAVFVISRCVFVEIFPIWWVFHTKRYFFCSADDWIIPVNHLFVPSIIDPTKCSQSDKALSSGLEAWNTRLESVGDQKSRDWERTLQMTSHRDADVHLKSRFACAWFQPSSYRGSPFKLDVWISFGLE